MRMMMTKDATLMGATTEGDKRDHNKRATWHRRCASMVIQWVAVLLIFVSLSLVGNESHEWAKAEVVVDACRIFPYDPTVLPCLPPVSQPNPPYLNSMFVIKKETKDSQKKVV